MEAGDDSCPINRQNGCYKWISIYKNKIAFDALNNLNKKINLNNKKNKIKNENI